MSSRPQHLLTRFPLLHLEDPSSFLWPWTASYRLKASFSEQGYQFSSLALTANSADNSRLFELHQNQLLNHPIHYWGSAWAFGKLTNHLKEKNIHPHPGSSFTILRSHEIDSTDLNILLPDHFFKRLYQIELKAGRAPFIFHLHRLYLKLFYQNLVQFEPMFHLVSDAEIQNLFFHFIKVAEDDFSRS